MLTLYETLSWSPTAKAYLRWRIQKLFNASIVGHAQSAFSPKLGAYLDWLRRKTEVYGFLSDAAHEWSILSSSPQRFRYVEFMRRHPRLARPTLLLVKGYSWLRAKL